MSLQVALFIKWYMPWAGPLWLWAVKRVDRWHDEAMERRLG